MAMSECSNSEVRLSFRGIVIDRGGTEANEIQMYVGNTVANSLLKVHWATSYQRVADKVCKIAEETRAYNTVAFSRPSSKSVLLPLQVLCRKHKWRNLPRLYTALQQQLLGESKIMVANRKGASVFGHC